MGIAATEGLISKRVDKRKIVDIHRHCMASPSSAREKIFESVFKNLIGWKEQRYGATITASGISTIAYRELNDIDAQVQVTDEAGITLSLLSFSMQCELICRKLPLAPEKLAAKKLNDRTADLVARHPGKLAFLATVNPMNKSSVAECERCIRQLGAKGANVSTSWQGKFLDHDKLDHFWEYADDQSIPVYLHPPLLPIGYQSMNKYRLEETVGRPFDTAMTVARMIYSGVFDRYPRLQVVLPHMGGGLPDIWGASISVIASDMMGFLMARPRFAGASPAIISRATSTPT